MLRGIVHHVLVIEIIIGSKLRHRQLVTAVLGQLGIQLGNHIQANCRCKQQDAQQYVLPIAVPEADLTLVIPVPIQVPGLIVGLVGSVHAVVIEQGHVHTHAGIQHRPGTAKGFREAEPSSLRRFHPDTEYPFTRSCAPQGQAEGFQGYQDEPGCISHDSTQNIPGRTPPQNHHHHQPDNRSHKGMIQYFGEIPPPGVGMADVIPEDRRLRRRGLGRLSQQVLVADGVQSLIADTIGGDPVADLLRPCQLFPAAAERLAVACHNGRHIRTPLLELLDGIQADPQIPQEPDAPQLLGVSLRVVPVSIFQTLGIDQTFLFVISDGGALNAHLMLQFLNSHGRSLLSLPILYYKGGLQSREIGKIDKKTVEFSLYIIPSSR